MSARFVCLQRALLRSNACRGTPQRTRARAPAAARAHLRRRHLEALWQVLPREAAQHLVEQEGLALARAAAHRERNQRAGHAREDAWGAGGGSGGPQGSRTACTRARHATAKGCAQAYRHKAHTRAKTTERTRRLWVDLPAALGLVEADQQQRLALRHLGRGRRRRAAAEPLRGGGGPAGCWRRCTSRRRQRACSVQRAARGAPATPPGAAAGLSSATRPCWRPPRAPGGLTCMVATGFEPRSLPGSHTGPLWVFLRVYESPPR